MISRGPTPSLLSGSNGKPRVAIIQRRRNCHRCSSTMPQGEKCFEVPKMGGGFSGKKSYCKTCFEQILQKSQEDLEAAKALLE